MPLIPYTELLLQHRSKIIWAILIFWLALGAMVYSSEMLAYIYFGAPKMDAIEVKQYLLRWLLWLLFTPIILVFGLKINISNTKIIWFIIIHMILASLLLVVEFFIEVALLRPMAELYYHRIVTLNEMIIPFLYKYFAYVVNYFLMVGMINMYVYTQRYMQTQQHLLHTAIKNTELEHALAIQHLAKLKMQIRPHFLFNTLNALNGLIMTRQVEKAEYMLSRLSELLRRTLDSSVDEFVTVQEEMEHIDIYMDIQRLRFDDRIQYHKTIDQGAIQARIPFFILQPLVENAIKYSVEIQDEPIELIIEITIEKQQVHLEVKHTFCELPPRDLQGHGIGLANVRERLLRYYGDNAQLNLLINHQGYTFVQINLPYADK